MTEQPIKKPLQQLVVRRLDELGLSLREAAAHSGGKISHSTLARFSRGDFAGRIRPDTVLGLARALQVSEATVWKAAEDTVRPEEFVRLSQGFGLLSAEDQQRVIDLMLELREETLARERERIARERPFG